jgi:hypothetical protein
MSEKTKHPYISVTHEELEQIRDLLRNGAPEWLVLIEVLNNEGTVGNAPIQKAIREMGWQLSNARLSQARKNLEKNGLEAIRTDRVYYKLEYALLTEYAELIRHAKNIVEIIEENKTADSINRLQKKGIIKRRVSQ